VYPEVLGDIELLLVSTLNRGQDLPKEVGPKFGGFNLLNITLSQVWLKKKAKNSLA
jgi:hypothetical protein